MQVAGSPFAAFRATPAAPASTRLNFSSVSTSFPQVQFGRDRDTTHLSDKRAEESIKKICSLIHERIRRIHATRNPTVKVREALALQKNFSGMRTTYTEKSARQLLTTHNKPIATSDLILHGFFHEVGNFLFSYTSSIQLAYSMPSNEISQRRRDSIAIKNNKELLETALSRYNGLSQYPAQVLDNVFTFVHPLADKNDNKIIDRDGHQITHLVLPTKFIEGQVHLSSKVSMIKFYTVLSNWIHNAMKYTNHGTVMLDNQVVEENAGESQWQFTIQDTGQGMSQETMDKINAGIPIRDENVGSTPGSGFGASLSTALIQEMGGSIRVCKPDTGIGTKVVICFPVEPAQGSAEPVDEKAATSSLLVDA